MPTSDQTIDLYVTLNPVPTATTFAPTTIPTVLTPFGGDAGCYLLSCNVSGASVYFNTVNTGTITEGILTVQVYITGTPYKTYRVGKNRVHDYIGISACCTCKRPDRSSPCGTLSYPAR